MVQILIGISSYVYNMYWATEPVLYTNWPNLIHQQYTVHNYSLLYKYSLYCEAT